METGLIRRIKKSIGSSDEFVLICGSMSRASGAKTLVDAILNDRRCCGTYAVLGSVPDISELQQAQADLQASLRSDTTIVAVGGGKVIDFAKLLASAHDVPAVRSGSLPCSDHKPRRLVIVSTAFGSGAEVTPYAALYDGPTKLSVPLMRGVRRVHYSLESYSALPATTKASTGIDAICHSIEALLSIGGNPKSRHYARNALRAAIPTLHRVVSGIHQDEDLLALAYASRSAGIAISSARTNIPHALSYYLTRQYGVPHGLAVALSMGRFLESFGSAINDRRDLRRWAGPYRLILDAMNAESHTSIAATWDRYIAGIGLPTCLCNAIAPSQRQNVIKDKRLASNTGNPERFSNSPIANEIAAASGLFRLYD